MRKGIRKHVRVQPINKVMENFTMTEMFERFIWFKQSEGLAQRTLNDYTQHFNYLLEYFEGDLSREEINLDSFMYWIDYMLNEQGLQPTTVNVRVRTMRAFLRWCYLEKLIEEPIHDCFKPIKTA